MPSSLTELFADITRGLSQDRDTLNSLDHVGDGDAGDNMVHNFETITEALRQADGQNATVDQALQHASQVLRQNGQGKTAEMYANGLMQAASNFQGKQGFNIGDIATLLNGLLGGVQNTPGVRSQGGGGLLDGLLPGVMAFMQSKNAGDSLIESLMKGYSASQRGAYGTTGSESSFGGNSTDTRGRVDPGAAGASSLLGSLFNSLLSNGLKAGTGKPLPSSGFDELFGGLSNALGGGGTQQQQPQQPQNPLGGGLGDLFGQLFGGGGGLGGALGGALGDALGGGQAQQAPRSNQRGDEPRARITGEESM